MKLILLSIIFLILFSSTVFAFFQPVPKINLITDECLIENNTHMFIISVLNKYSILGKDADKTILEIHLENASISQIVSMTKGDKLDFDTQINNTLIDYDMLHSGYYNSAIIFFNTSNQNILLKINVTMFYGGSFMTTNYSKSLELCEQKNITKYFSSFTNNSAKFLGNWMDFWNTLSGRNTWDSKTSLSILESLVSLTGTSFSLSLIADPGWLDIGSMFKDSFSKKTPVIGTHFNLLTKTTENLLADLIIFISSWTPQTEKVLSNVDELQNLLEKESKEWNKQEINYTKIGNIINQINSKINEMDIEREKNYYNNLKYYQLSGLMSILEDFLQSLKKSVVMRKTEVLKHTTIENIFERNIKIESIFNKTKLSGLIINLTSLGNLNISTGYNNTKCVVNQYGNHICSKNKKKSFTSLKIYENDTKIYDTNFQWDQIQGTDWYTMGWWEAGIRYNYSYFLKPNKIAQLYIAIGPNIELAENTTAIINITTLDTSDELRYSLQRLFFENNYTNNFLGINTLLPYCMNKERNLKIKLKQNNRIFEFNKKLKTKTKLNLSLGQISLTVLPELYLRKELSMYFSKSENITIYDFIPGDVNSDNKITKNDLIEIKKSFRSLVNENHDVNCDGVIDILDLSIIGKHVYNKGDLEIEQINVSIKMIKLKGIDKLDEGVMLVGYHNITGFLLKDTVNHTYTFPHFFLSDNVFIHTDHGHNNDTDLFWNRSSAIWNNNGDAAILLSPSGIIIDRQECYEDECWY